MSASELPEDLRQWPDDPFELLGVSTDVEERDLRRAYTRLIRLFKPEQYPEHFRRIRTAYENALQRVQLFQRFRFEAAEEDPTPEPAPPAEESLPAWNSPPAEPDVRDELPQLWQRAIAGEDAAVYHRLVELHDRDPGNTDICIRLYWLLVLNPDLDAKRARCDWLATGLHRSGLSGPLRELYRREIATDPEEAISPRCTRLLDAAARAGALADMLEWRWQAIGRLSGWQVNTGDMAQALAPYVDVAALSSHWQTIVADVDRFRERIAREDDEVWLRLLLTAVEQLLPFGDIPDVSARLAEYGREIDRHQHLHHRAADGLDRLDFLRDVAKGWQQLRHAPWPPPALLRLVPLSWTRPFTEIRPLLLAYLEQVYRWPGESLKSFDAAGARSAHAVRLPAFPSAIHPARAAG